jgi:hypothetical protein
MPKCGITQEIRIQRESIGRTQEPIWEIKENLLIKMTSLWKVKHLITYI